MPPTSNGREIADLLAQAVREALRGLPRPPSVPFDCRVPAMTVRASAAELRAGFDRLIDAAFTLWRGSALSIDLEGRVVSSQLALAGRVALAEPALPHNAIDAARERLRLDERGSDNARLRRADGRCPYSGARLSLAQLGGAGALLRFDLSLPLVQRTAPAQPDAEQARAWVVDPDEAAAQSVVERLQRFGWATWHFASVADAMRRRRSMSAGHARPALIVAGGAEASVERVQPLLHSMLATTRCVLALPGGAVCAPRRSSPIERLAWPLSDSDLDRLTREVAPPADPPSGDTMPLPMVACHRHTLLVVDDEVSRVLIALEPRHDR